MKSNRGFTLIEIAVVLAIIAILAAILTPIVTSYIDQARVTRASADTKKIAEGILLFKRDTGVFPPYNLLTTAKLGNTADVDCLVSGTLTSAATAPFIGSWSCATPGLLTQYLNVNSLGLPSTNESASAGGIVNFRGPYLDGLNGTDPWANPYIVNSKYLAATGPNAGNHAFALSAGPNGIIDTAEVQANASPFAVSGDDIASMIK